MALVRWQATILFEQAGILTKAPFASIQVRNEISGALPQLYDDYAGTITKGNPFNADAEAYAYFHVIGGLYRIDATLGAQTFTWRYEPIGLGGASDAPYRTERIITASGTITGLVTDSIIAVNKSADETTDYNAVASELLEQDEITLKDLKGNANTYRLRFVPTGSETIDGQSYFDVTRDHGWVTARKKSGGGWYVVGSSE